jgi:hypothetical protein
MYRDDLEARLHAAELRAKELEEDLQEERAKSEQLEDELEERKEQNSFSRRWKRRYPYGFFHHTKLFWTLAGAAGLIIGIILLFGVFGPPGCSESLRGGIVTNLYHHHPYNTTSQVCTGSGNSRHCHPVTHHHPEKWTVEFCDEGVCERPTIEQERWDRLHVGDYFCYRPPCSRHSEREELYRRD